MQDIEPFYFWRDFYASEEDKNSPFYGRKYSEFYYTQKIYNFYIHPQWDYFGSKSLYCKILYCDYAKNIAVIEFIGQWNDALHNDIMHLKRNVIDHLVGKGICKFLLIIENVLDFHASDDCYYQEWKEDIEELKGWIVFAGIRDHVFKEMYDFGITEYVFIPEVDNEIYWRKIKPQQIAHYIEKNILQIREE